MKKNSKLIKKQFKNMPCGIDYKQIKIRVCWSLSPQGLFFSLFDVLKNAASKPPNGQDACSTLLFGCRLLRFHRCWCFGSGCHSTGIRRDFYVRRNVALPDFHELDNS